MQASSRPETALFGNFVVRLRIPLCGVLEYASAEILVFLELAQKSLVSASRTTQFPPEFPDGNGLVLVRKRRFFAISASGGGFPCAAYTSTPPRKSLPSLTLQKNRSFPPRELRCPIQGFRMGTSLQISPTFCCGRKSAAICGVCSHRGAQRTASTRSAPLRSQTPHLATASRPRDEGW